MNLLLKAGAEVNAQNHDGQTILMLAKALNRQAVMKILITGGAVLN
jgi:ankyrin repeat protein